MKPISRARQLWLACRALGLRLYTVRRVRRAISLGLVVLTVLAGAWLRWGTPHGEQVSPRLRLGWRPLVTLYFRDGPFLVPVSRRLAGEETLPRAALKALLSGRTASGLVSPLPADAQLRSFTLANRVARIDFSRFPVGEPDRELATAAIVDTLVGLADVEAVAISVAGETLVAPTRRVPLVYYVEADRLVALPASVRTPRAALAAYLTGPPDDRLIGLPEDVRLLRDAYDPRRGLLAVDLSYTEGVRLMALTFPDRMRLVLIGLLATLTEFPEVKAVRLDFEGRARLGLGQCSDLLRTPQPRPRLLNDERLLRRRASVGGS